MPSDSAGLQELETDYLVVGAGAVAMAFVDTLIEDSDLDVVMVDRRAAPGGHWLDAYPFVQLHQPSANYGVSSTPSAMTAAWPQPIFTDHTVTLQCVTRMNPTLSAAMTGCVETTDRSSDEKNRSHPRGPSLGGGRPPISSSR